MQPDTVVVLEGVDGEKYTLAGPNAGDKGVYLSTGVTGLYDPPVKVVWEQPGNYPGSRYLNHRVLQRDLVFGVEILHEDTASWLSRDSAWRKAWSFEADCTLSVTTKESGTRKLKLRLGESPEVDTFTDPRMRTINLIKMITVAGDPFWYADDEIYTAVTKTDTSFDPNTLGLPWPWPQTELPVETLTIDVPTVNPTDQIIWPRWSVPGSTYAPAEPYVPWLPWLGAPKSRATIWTVPDYSFKDDENKDRRLRLPGLIGGLRTNEIQQLSIEGRPTGGTFKLKLGTETTAAIPYNPTPAQIETALVALAQVAAGDVDVTQDPAINEQQTVELQGGATGGTWRLNFEGEWTDPIAFNAGALEVYTKLGALPSVPFIGLTVDQKVQNCVQEIRILGEPNAGSFTLSLDGKTTDPIPYNANNLQVAIALAKLTNIGTFDIAVSGGSLLGGNPPVWKAYFQGQLSGVDINKLTADVGDLSGGAGISVQTKILTRGGRRYTVTFGGDLSGYNASPLTADAAGLTGGVKPSVLIQTARQGSHLYVINFQGALSGKNLPQLEPISSLTGGRNPKVITATRLEGYTAPAENAYVDTDPRVEQIVSESGSALWARMNGVRFKHFAPPYTGPKKFEISVSGCIPGQMVALRLPRPYSRPWG